MTEYIAARVADAHRQDLLAAADRYRLSRGTSEARSRFGRRRGGIRAWVKSASRVAMPDPSPRAGVPIPSARPINC